MLKIVFILASSSLSMYVGSISINIILSVSSKIFEMTVVGDDGGGVTVDVWVVEPQCVEDDDDRCWCCNCWSCCWCWSWWLCSIVKSPKSPWYKSKSPNELMALTMGCCCCGCGGWFRCWTWSCWCGCAIEDRCCVCPLGRTFSLFAHEAERVVETIVMRRYG